MDRLSYKVALGGMFTALCTLLMILTGVFPMFYLVLPMIAGALLMIIRAEVSTSWALLTYTAVSILSVLVTFDKSAALIFILFLGHYPITKQYFDKIRPTPLRILVKAAMFTLCVILDYYLTIYLLAMPEITEEFAALGKFAIPFLVLLLGWMFFAYDYALSGFTRFYTRWFKPRILGK